ncbi:hypothetical protein [Microbacterium oxydans]|uniref:hypothetical protein n=1 Tax=Microbacterium oxydans TaxID=82380 RepID=UPI001121BFA0|nr:hypothetical protein [Microbacterium oxydans]
MQSPSRLVLASLRRRRADFSSGIEAITTIEAATADDPVASERVAQMKRWFEAELGMGSKLSRPQQREVLNWWEQHLDDLDDAVFRAANATNARRWLSEIALNSAASAIAAGGVAAVGALANESEERPQQNSFTAEVELVRRADPSSTPGDIIGPPADWGAPRLAPQVLEPERMTIEGPYPSLREPDRYAHGIRNIRAGGDTESIRLLRLESLNGRNPTSENRGVDLTVKFVLELPQAWIQPGQALYWVSGHCGHPGATLVFTLDSCAPSQATASGFHEHTIQVREELPN